MTSHKRRNAKSKATPPNLSEIVSEAEARLKQNHIKFSLPETAMFTRHRAVGFFVAAGCVPYDLNAPNGHVATEPKYFLYGHAIELGLKAYLMINGYSEEECRKRFSHNLEKALICAERHGLAISDWHRALIKGVSREHNKPFSFRYFNSQGWAAPSFENLSECCRWLLAEIQIPIFAANALPLGEENASLRR